jgi:hypothetical protein
MNLQDRIDQFQKRVFAHFRPSSNNECRIAALVPLVEESYGIYKFITSMLRAMHRRKCRSSNNIDSNQLLIHVLIGTDAMDALSELRTRYNSQHYALLRFYYECSNLRYLTSLISVPKLPQDPPSLIESDAPSRAKKPTTPPPAASPEPVVDFWSENQAKQQREYEDEQRRLQQQQEEEQNRQRMLQQQQQREFEEQQRLQAERERQRQEELMRQQMQHQAEGRVNELERELMAMRNQFERDQMLLEQYDRVC